MSYGSEGGVRGVGKRLLGDEHGRSLWGEGYGK